MDCVDLVSGDETMSVAKRRAVTPEEYPRAVAVPRRLPSRGFRARPCDALKARAMGSSRTPTRRSRLSGSQRSGALLTPTATQRPGRRFAPDFQRARWPGRQKSRAALASFAEGFQPSRRTAKRDEHRRTSFVMAVLACLALAGLSAGVISLAAVNCGRAGTVVSGTVSGSDQGPLGARPFRSKDPLSARPLRC